MGCDDGRERFAADRQHEVALTDAESAELTRGILAQTSGTACDRAHVLIGVDVYGDLAGVDTKLLGSHVAHCRGCAELTQAMAWTKALLPEMALIDTDADFVIGVLRTTTGAKRPATVPMWLERLREYGQSLWLRPRFALEAAYIGTMALLLLFGTPFSPGSGAPNRALDVAAATLAPNLADLERAAGRGVRIWGLGRENVGRALRDVGADLDERSQRAAVPTADLRTDAGEMIDAAQSFEFELAVGHLGAMGGDLARIWHGFFGEEPVAVATERTTD